MERIDRPSSEPAAAVAPAVVAAPNAPKRTFPSERFMAFDMSRVRIVPDAPTSVPATMRSWFDRVKPAMATASPVYALRSEMTTGMSAPPIGMTSATPKTSATIAIATRKVPGATAKTPVRPDRRIAAASRTIASTSSPVTACCPG